ATLARTPGPAPRFRPPPRKPPPPPPPPPIIIRTRAPFRNRARLNRIPPLAAAPPRPAPRAGLRGSRDTQCWTPVAPRGYRSPPGVRSGAQGSCLPREQSRDDAL